MSSRIVLTAGHCATAPLRVWFGDALDVDLGEDGTPVVSSAESHRSIQASFCLAYPGQSWEEDLGFCVLDEAVDDVPIISIAAGCERTHVIAGASATLVGYGAERPDARVLGTKRVLVTEVARVRDDIEIGNASEGSCHGDSGGPAFLRVPSPASSDGEWRLFGILSSGIEGRCGPGFYIDVSRFTSWLDENSGEDLQPCFASDGAWDPGPGCRVPPYDSSGRPREDAAEPSRTCGEPYVPEESDVADCAVERPRSGGGATLLLQNALALAAAWRLRARVRRREARPGSIA